MLCPVCKTVELKMSDRQGVEIDYCPQCRGVWLDRGELDKIIERSEQPFAGGRPAAAPSQPMPPAPMPPAPYASKRDDDDDDDYDRNRYPRRDSDDYRDSGYDSRKPKKKSMLGDLFDIF